MSKPTPKPTTPRGRTERQRRLHLFPCVVCGRERRKADSQFVTDRVGRPVGRQCRQECARSAAK